MDYLSFQQRLKVAGITLAELARLLKQNPNSITNYSHLGYVPAHLAVIAALLCELVAHGIPFEPVIEQLNIKPKNPRGRSLGRLSNCSKPDTLPIAGDHAGGLLPATESYER